MVPVFFHSPSMKYSEPKASQLSSTNQRLCFLQKSTTTCRLKGFPKLCAIITALVFGERAASNCVVSILLSSMLISTNTGTAPYCTIQATVVGNPAATVITSSPRFIWRSFNSGAVRALKARRLADEPELQSEQYFTPNHLANPFSNLWAQGPAVNQKSSDASTRLTISSSSK